MRDIKISIIMPAYNAAKFVLRCIESVQRQTYMNWELIIVDDGSIDSTCEICEKITIKDTRIKLISNQHGGTAKARNTAIKIADGKYITFIDADDVYHPKFLESLINATIHHNADIAICGLVRGSNSEGFISTVQKPQFKIIDKYNVFERMYNGEWGKMIAPNNKLYAREVFDKVSFPDGCYFEDAATTNLALYYSKNICMTDTALYYYYITPNSSSATKKSYELLDREKALRSHWQFFMQENKKELAFLALPFYLIELISIFHRIEESECPEKCQLIRRYFNETYKKYHNKIRFSEQQADQILAFRYPMVYDIRNMVRKDGYLKTISSFIKRKMEKL